MVIEEEASHGGTTDPTEGSHAVDRITLQRLLLAGLDDVVHFDKKFERYERMPDGGVKAFFADGTSANGDVLVGAEGSGSGVRRQYLPQARRYETEAGSVALKLPLTEQSRAWLPPRFVGGMNMVVAPAPYFLFTSVFERRSEVVLPIGAEVLQIVVLTAERETDVRTLEENCQARVIAVGSTPLPVLDLTIFPGDEMRVVGTSQGLVQLARHAAPSALTATSHVDETRGETSH